MDFKVFSPKGLQEALTANNYPVSRSTVDRWKAGAQPTREDIRAIRDLLFPEDAKEAAPSVTRRLLAGVMALEKNARISDVELADAIRDAAAWERESLEADARLAERLARSPRKRAARAGDPTGGQVDGSPSSRRRKRK